MAKGLDLRVHHIAKDPQRGDVLVRANPYIRVSHQGEPPIFLQNGQAFYEGSGAVPFEEWPGWLVSEMRKLDKNVLSESGFDSVPGDIPPPTFRSERVQKLDSPSRQTSGRYKRVTR